jgi:tRNA pseudouridine synthase 10
VVEAQGKFALCKMCAEREGREVRFAVANGNCFICEGLTSQVDSFVRKAVRVTSKYEFRTFAVGLILPPGVQNREDELRSEYKIRGRETVKSQISGKITNAIARTMRKSVDRLHPDLTVLIDTGRETIDVGSKSLFAYCRYSKPSGVAQRKRFCERCGGRGCEHCHDTGYERVPSVEECIENRLRRLLKAQRMKFTWLGTEDEESVVHPPGRPMLMEIKSPVKRNVPKRMVLRTGRGAARVTGLRILKAKPTHVPPFFFKTRTVIKPAGRILPEDLRRMVKGMNGVTVQYLNNKGKTVYKKVRSVKARYSGGTITADITLDGGLPVRRLISGESVSPSFSELLRTPLNCQRFDILRVWEAGGFEFGKI